MNLTKATNMFLSVMLFVLIKLRSPSTLCKLTPSLIILGKFAEGVIGYFGREYLRPSKAMNWKFRYQSSANT